MSTTNIKRAAQLDEELNLLTSLCSDLTDQAHLGVYGDWLEDQGDERRAEFVRQYATALAAGEGFPDSEGFSEAWLSAIGYRLASSACKYGMADERFTLLKLAKPSLKYEASNYPPPLTEDTFPVGSSKVYGIPDLPAGSVWPTQKECNTLYDPESGIDPDLPCSFVAQINCEELGGTLLADYFPKTGLISFFSCSEIESIGMTDGYVTFSPDTSNLVRMNPPTQVLGPAADEANQLAQPEAFEFVESLEVPHPGEESPFEEIQWPFDSEPAEQIYEVVEEAGVTPLSSLGGFTTPTTGDDPLPGKDWCKLICVSNSIQIRLHFCIRYEDLRAGKFDNVELAWVDFD